MGFVQNVEVKNFTPLSPGIGVKLTIENLGCI